MDRGRIRKYSRRALKGVGYLLAFVVVIVLVVLAALDTGFVRARVRQLTHLPIDWKHTSLSLTRGLVLEGFSLQNGPPFRSTAPNFVEIDRIEVSWSYDRLFRKDALTERIAISGARVAFVFDENGQSSLTTLRTEPTPPEPSTEPPTPPSRALESLGKRLPVGKLTVHDTRVRVIQLAARGPHEVEAVVDADVILPRPNEVEGQLAVHVLKQTLLAGVPPITDLLRLEARASFRPVEQRVLVWVPKLYGLDGALAAEASLELPDSAPPLLTRAQIALETAPIQRTLDHEHSPLHLAGKIKVLAEQVRLGALPTVDPTGRVDLDVKLDRMALRTPGNTADGERIDIDFALRAPARQVAPAPSTPLGHAKLGLRIGRFTFAQRSLRFTLGDGDLDLAIDGLDPYAKKPLEIARAVHSHGKLGRLEVRPGEVLVLAEALSIDTAAEFPAGADPGSLKIDAPIRALTVSLAQKSILRGEPGRLHIDLAKARLDPDDLLASEGEEHSELSAGPVVLRSHLTKHKDDAVAFDLDARARHLGPLTQLVPLPKGMSVPFSEIAAHGHTTGRISGLRKVATIQIDERSQLELARPALRGGPVPTRAKRMMLTLASHGSLMRHGGDLAIRNQGLVVGEAALGDPVLTTKWAIDRGRPKLTAVVAVRGGESPTLALDADVDFQRPGRTLGVDVHLTASQLAQLARILPRSITDRHQLAWSKLSLKLDGKLGVRGVVTDFADLAPRIARDPLESARGDGKIDVVASGVDYKDREGALAVALDKLTCGVTLRGTDGDAQDKRPLRQVHVEVGVGELKAKQGDHTIKAAALKPVVTLDARGRVRAPEVVTALDLEAGKLEQDYYPTYPVGQLKLGTTVRGDTRGILRVERFELDNPAAGSRLSLKGGVDLVSPLRDPRSTAEIQLSEAHDERAQTTSETPRRLPGRIGIDAQIEVEQKLGSFPLAKGITAGGVVTLPVHIQSADLALFSVRGVLGLQHVRLNIAGEKESAPALRAENVHGRIPLAAEVLVDRHKQKDGTVATKLKFVPHPEGVSFPRPQFAEHQPFLTQRSYFSVDKVKVRSFELGPLAGNLSIDHTRLDLSQLEAHVSGGRIRGQLIAAIAGEDSKVLFRGDVTGLMPPRAKKWDDRLDANMAILIEPVRLTIQGRTELVHISRALLLDLMDVWDPYHAEVAANRVRLGLKLGYPDQVRLVFDQGFASASIKLGGMVSGLVRIDEIKNVPMGPLLERYLGPVARPLLESTGAQEAPKPEPKKTEPQKPEQPKPEPKKPAQQQPISQEVRP